MSNYKPRIESNNLDLTSILSTVNELPEAGPSVETCTISFTGGNTFIFSGQTPDGIVNSSEHPSGSSVTVIKGTMFYVSAKRPALNVYVADGSFIGVMSRTGITEWLPTTYPFVYAYATGDVTFYANVD